MAFAWNVIHLGRIDQRIDPREGNATSENAKVLVGREFGGPDDPLWHHIIEMTTIDEGGWRNALDTDNSRIADKMRFDLGDGPQETVYDGLGLYDATLTYTDGTTATVSAVLAQDDQGNLFLMPELSDNADTAAYEAKAIESIRLNELWANSANLATDRHVTQFICFAEGTLIDTARGAVPIERLRAGDRVRTLDHGLRPLAWRGCLRGPRVPAVRIAAGALGPGMPQRPLVVTRQHRLLVASPIAARLFGAPQVLVAAGRLVGLPGIAAVPRTGRFHHLLFDRHEVVLANGAPAESLLPGPVALDALPPADRLICATRFADLSRAGRPAPAARPIPPGREQRRLAQRHMARPGLALVPAAALGARCPAPLP